MSDVVNLRLAPRPKLKPLPLDPPHSRVLFVFRGPRGGNILSAALYPLRRGTVLALFAGTREWTLRFGPRPSRDLRHSLTGKAGW